MPEVDVVHLVWKPTGIAAFREFLQSYRENEAGIDHNLLIAFKAFSGDDLSEYRALLDGIPHRELRAPGGMLDLGTYFWAAEQSAARFVCFLNSNSTLLVPGWLNKLYEHVKRPDVGAVGATGSWESFYSSYLLRMEEVGPPRTLPAWVKHLNRLRKLQRYKANFPPAPNPHLRSNAFIVERMRWLGLERASLRSKWSTWLLESGRRGVTPQLLAQGLKVVVVGRDGREYPPDEWPRSMTYRQGEQENLLVADNRTRQYAAAAEKDKQHMRRIAWGE